MKALFSDPSGKHGVQQHVRELRSGGPTRTRGGHGAGGGVPFK
jgi:hypothetical protein